MWLGVSLPCEAWEGAEVATGGIQLSTQEGSKPLRKHSLKSWAAERVTVGHQGHISLYKHSNLLSPNPDFYFSVGFTEKFSKINFTAKDYEQGFGKAS